MHAVAVVIQKQEPADGKEALFILSGDQTTPSQKIPLPLTLPHTKVCPKANNHCYSFRLFMHLQCTLTLCGVPASMHSCAPYRATA